MKYVNKLTDEQIKELIFMNNLDKMSFKIIRYNNFIHIQFINQSHILTDFNYSVSIISNKNILKEFNKEYRKKMLEYFGEQYAIDYLLGE